MPTLTVTTLPAEERLCPIASASMAFLTSSATVPAACRSHSGKMMANSSPP